MCVCRGEGGWFSKRILVQMQQRVALFFLIKNQKTTSNACIFFISPVGMEVDFFLILAFKKEKTANTWRPWAASRWTAGR